MINNGRVPNPPINPHKIRSMFKQIDCLVGQLLDKVSDILISNGIRYFIKPNRQSLLRMLTPYELKVYVDFTDVCCLFDNRSEIIRHTIQREKGSQSCHNNKIVQPIINQQIITSLNDIPIRNKVQPIEKSVQLTHYLKYPNIQHTSYVQPERIINPQSENNFGQFRSLNMANKYYVQKILKQKICEWAKYEISKGKTVTRIDVRNKAVQIGAKCKIKFGARWLNKFIGHDNDIRQLLTHGNSNELKKAKINSSYVNLKPGINAQDVKQQNKELNQNGQESENSQLYGLYEQEEKQEGSPYMSEQSIQNGHKTGEGLAYRLDNSYKYYKQDSGVQPGYQDKVIKK